MTVDEQKLKEEMQRGGFLSEFKQDHVPDSTEMSERAIEKYEENKPDLSADRVQHNFSSILASLIEIETDIFEVRSNEVYPYAMTEFLKKHFESGQASMAKYNDSTGGPDYTKYPQTQALLQEIRQTFNAYDDFQDAFEKIFPKVYPLMKPIAESERQSAGKRAGLGFKNHIESLIEIGGVRNRE